MYITPLGYTNTTNLSLFFYKSTFRRAKLDHSISKR